MNAFQPHSLRPRPAGFSLLELIVVLVVLVALAGIVVPLVTGVGEDARETGTRASMAALRDTISQYYLDMNKTLPRPINGARIDHPQLFYLYVNPRYHGDSDANTGDAQSDWDPRYSLGWHGPYLIEATGTYSRNDVEGFTRDYGETGDRCMLDAWGSPLIIQSPPNAGIAPTSPTGPLQVRIVSAGPNRRIDTERDTLTEAFVAGATGDDLLLTFELN